MKLPVRYRVPDSQVKDDIRWLEIVHADGGFYLFQCTEPGMPKWDSFYQTLDDIFEDCGIPSEEWVEYKP